MTVSGMIWFLVGGVLGCFLGGITALNVAFIRDYNDRVDYYDLDPIEINTTSYEDVIKYEDFDFE